MKQRVMKYAAFLMSICLFLVAVLATTQSVRATVFTFNPVADAPVREERPDSNLGGFYQLKAWSSPENISFLRFDVQNLDAPVTMATLRLYTVDSSALGITVQAVSDNSWDEMAIAYNNAPPIGSVVNTSGAIVAQSWVEVDVTSYVTGEGLFSLAVTTADTNLLRFFSKEGTYAPELIIETGNGTPPPPLNADFTAVPVSGNVPLAVTFNDNSTGNIIAYDWDFGDGNSSTQSSPVHTYTEPGIYTVSLTVTEVSGLTDTLTRTNYISVTEITSDPITADFSANPISGTVPLTVTFTNNSLGDITNYLWDFGDGNTSAETNPVHTYVQAGTYTVTLTAIGATGSDTLTRTAYITVEEIVPIIPQIVIDPLSVLLVSAGDTAPLSAVVYDAYGNPDPSAPITWSVSDPASITVQVDPVNDDQATVIANVTVGSALVTATSGDLSASIPIIIAILEPETRVIDVNLVESVAYDPDDILLENPILTLSLTAETETITSGDILVASATTERINGFMIQVLQADTLTDTVTVVAQTVGLTDAFARLQIDLELPKTIIPSQVISAPKSQNLFKPMNQTGFGSLSGGNKYCEDKGYLVEAKIVNWEIVIPATPVAPVLILDLEGGNINYFYAGVDIDLDVEFTETRIELQGEGTYEFECVLPLPQFIPGILIASTGLSIQVQPEIGIKGKGFMEFGEAIINMGQGMKFVYAGRYGIEYDPAVGEVVPVVENGEPTFDTAEGINFETGFDFQLSGELFVFGGVTLGVTDAVSGFLPKDIIRVDLIQARLGYLVELGVPIEAIIYSPKPPNSRYQNPDFALSGLLEVKLILEIEGEVGNKWSRIQNRIFPQNPLIFNIDEPVLFAIQGEIGSTPDTTLSSPTILATPGYTVELSIAARPFPGVDVPGLHPFPVLGSVERWLFEDRPVELWASLDGGEAFLLGETTIDNLGNATFSWAAPEVGRYEIAALVYDRLLGSLPIIPKPYMTNSVTLYTRLAASDEITINDFNANPDRGVFPLSTTFSWDIDYSGTSPALICTIDPGDGVPPYIVNDCQNGITQTHTYTNTGRYTAVLVVDDENGSAVATAVISNGNEWPSRLHDAASTGYNPFEDTLQPPLKLVHRFDPPAGYFFPELTTPVVTEDHVYLLFSEANYPNYRTLIEARSREDGLLKWQTVVSGWVSDDNLVFNNNVLYVGIDHNYPNPATLYALSAITGDIMWQEDFTGWDLSTPVVAGDKLYILDRKDTFPNETIGIQALDKQTGESQWESIQEFSWFGAPIILNNVLAVATPDAILALDAITGENLWVRNDVNANTWSWDIVGDVANNLAIVWGDPGITALDANTGVTVWSYTGYDNGYDSANLVLAEGKLHHLNGYFSTYYSIFNAATGALELRTTDAPNPGGDYTFLTMANGVVYATTNSYYEQPLVRAIDAASGALLWSSATLDYSTAPIVIAGGRLYVTNHKGVAVYESAYTIAGRVTDELNNPMGGIEIAVDGDDGFNTSVTTDASGYYTVTGIFSSTYTLTPQFGDVHHTILPDSQTISVPPDASDIDFTVNLVNESPSASDDTRITGAGTPITINVLQNDTDPDGDVLTITSVTQPSNGAAIVNTNDTVTYTPAAGFSSGEDSFSYTISDGFGGTATATVFITVMAWQNDDIGPVGLAGSFTYTNSTFVVEGSGADISGIWDQFHYAYQPLSSNGYIIARVTSQTYTHFYAKSGLMIRENLTLDAPHTFIYTTPSGIMETSSRSTTGGITTVNSSQFANLPVWLKLERNGDTIITSRSSDGITWIVMDTITLALNSDVYIGLAVTSHDNSALSTAVFSDVTVVNTGN